MHKLFTSSYDASIYLQQPDQNTGRDEILEVGKLYYGSTMDVARTLIKFNTTQISQSIVESIGTGSYSPNKYNIDEATKGKIVYPSLDPSIFEVKFPNKDIKGRAL